MRWTYSGLKEFKKSLHRWSHPTPNVPNVKKNTKHIRRAPWLHQCNATITRHLMFALMLDIWGRDKTHEYKGGGTGQRKPDSLFGTISLPNGFFVFNVFCTGRIFEFWNLVASKQKMHFSMFESLKWPYLPFPCIIIAQSHFFQFGGGLIITYWCYLNAGVNGPTPCFEAA